MIHLAFMGINVGPGSADNTLSALSTIDEVLEVHEMHSRFVLLKIQKLRSHERYRRK